MDYSKEQVLAFFSRLVVTNCFKTDRDYKIANQMLNEHLGLDYDSTEIEEFETEYNKVVNKPKTPTHS